MPYYQLKVEAVILWKQWKKYFEKETDSGARKITKPERELAERAGAQGKLQLFPLFWR